MSWAMATKSCPRGLASRGSPRSGSSSWLPSSCAGSTRDRAASASPAWLRGRLLVRLSRHLVRRTYQGSRVVSRLRRGTANLDVRASLFCTVREPVPQPLCGFYAAAFTRLLSLFNLGARAEVVACRGTGEPTCVVRIQPLGGHAREGAAAA